MGEGVVQMFYLFCPFILEQNKKEQLTPFPPLPPHQSNDEGANKIKRAILASLRWGKGGPDDPFILSKIAAIG